MGLMQSVMLGGAFCFVVMSISWVVATKLNFFSLVDSVWAYGIGALVSIYCVYSNGFIGKKVVALLFALFWSLRLGTYLAIRLKAHFPQEDRRYIELKKKWGGFKFFTFFQFQGLSQIIFSLPFLFLAIDRDSHFSWTIYFGIVVFIIGFFGESVADFQLNRFRKNPKNKGEVCKVGLWKFSRHPNYFFEWLIWCGISISALGSEYGYLGLVSPFAMYLTLNYLTGIPAAEEQSLLSKGDRYREYQQSTNRFFPGVSR